MASKFRLQRYDWFGQKLLVQHQFSSLISLRQHVVKSTDSDTNVTRDCSDHLTYIQCLAFLKGSVRLDEIVVSLQRLNLERDSQSFLLLCRCLLYMGNYDSVVALCKQIINREIDSASLNQTLDNQFDDKEFKGDLLRFDSIDYVKEDTTNKGYVEKERSFLREESLELRKLLSNINSNHLINNPNLWLFLAIGLEFQHQFKDASFAYQIASRLSLGDDIDSSRSQSPPSISTTYTQSSEPKKIFLGGSDQIPCQEHARFLLQRARDYRTALRLLSKANERDSTCYNMNTLYALSLAGLSSSSNNNLTRAISVLTSLETHTKSYRNPCTNYNRLAKKCRPKSSQLQQFDTDEDSEDASRINLNFLLTKVYLVLNNIIQETGRRRFDEPGANQITLYEDQINSLIDMMLSSHACCQQSSSFWNNLGILYMIKRKQVASLSCLLKAHTNNPLDWRVNYNIALACSRVGLYARAANFCLKARNSILMRAHPSSKLLFPTVVLRSEPAISTVMGVIYEYLKDYNAARRAFLEGMNQSNTSQESSPVGPANVLINYLVFIHLHGHEFYEDPQSKMDPNDTKDYRQTVKLQLHLLDQFEQAWLQRNQNDPQFNPQLLQAANALSKRIADDNHTWTSVRRNYAWMKTDP